MNHGVFKFEISISVYDTAISHPALSNILATVIIVASKYLKEQERWILNMEF